MKNTNFMLKYVAILTLLLTSATLFAQDSQSVHRLFKEFQAGYRQRDTSSTETFCNKLFSKDIVIIGTGSDEWIEGISKAKTLVKNDWAYWLNLGVDTANINWHKIGNTILFEVKGSASISFPTKDDAYNFALAQLNRAVQSEGGNRAKLFAYAKESSSLIAEIEKGELNLRYAIRLTGALAQESNELKIKQLVFSFPYPMDRQK